ncbi:alpha/beta fold hydrolase [Altererythrobacter aerius]|uniref:Palmitoyl-protein thioesterase ABHD10, mitochondrial n=1 Tax=Tsuneonella aeria TaxID=1837929 RepID=A0A6I4THI1_9SPHN|nr:alpha/beta hydrolase [Tsuneonella aeria]MXO75525.1 alpha/beta fold hydrolase [Tsuneonella aeria]
MIETQYHVVGDRRIALRHVAGQGPAIVFLPGYMSDMAGSKACAVMKWARGEGRECLLLDYSGCGESDGAFAEGTLRRWRDEVLALIAARVRNPVILVGSSMGGWLMLLAGLALGERLHGLVGIAAAPDFTEWGRSAEDKARLQNGETVLDENPYGPDPTPMHPAFWADGQANLLLDDPIPLDCPVHLLHGMEDRDVPWEISLRLSRALRSPQVHLTLVKDGDHRLSREADIALLLTTIATI